MSKITYSLLILTVFFTASLILSVSGCNRQLSTTSINSKELIDPEEGEVMLEVYTKSEGMVYPLGTLLNIKLHSTGEAEFEYYLPSKNYGTPNETVKKTVLLEKNIFQQLKSLIEASDFRNANENYLSTKPMSDASTTMTIKYKSEESLKTIILKEADNHLHLEKKVGVYPKSLMDLLKLVENLRKKYEEEVALT